MDVVKLAPQADPRIGYLLQNIFSKVVLVRNYDEGM